MRLKGSFSRAENVSSQMSRKFLLQRLKNCIFQESKKFLLHESRRFLLNGIRASFLRV